MRRAFDPLLLAGAVLAAVVSIVAGASSLGWVGRTFPGFLVLENRVVASAGLATWPDVRDGTLFQSEIKALEGRPLGDARELAVEIEARPPGTPVRYLFRRDGTALERTISTRRFSGSDHILLFGSYLFCGLGLTGVALAIRFLAPRNAAATGSALALWLVGMFALTAADLYGPYRLFRLHALLECLLFAGTLHFAMVFPSTRAPVRRFPRLPIALYAAGGLLALVGQTVLYHPEGYTRVHQVAVAAFGASLAAVVATLVASFVRPEGFEARQRVKVVVLGALGALLPQVALALASSLSGGRAPENTMGWSGVLFPLAVGFAVIRNDLLRVDAILRRTLSYTIFTASVGAGYLAAVAAVESFLPGDAPGAGSSGGLLLAAALVLALLPLRDRIQGGVDRVFFRSAYDFRRLVEATSERLASVTDLGVLTAALRGAVEEALRPEWLAFEVRRPEQSELEIDALAARPDYVDPAALRRARERAAPVDVAAGGLLVPFLLEGRLVAVLALGRRLSGRFYGGYDRQLLQTLANQGAVAVENALALIELRELNRHLEQKVEDRTAELRETLARLHEAQGQLVHQEKMASVGRLVAGVAHEINNPLNFVQGNMHHLREHTRALASALEELERVLRSSVVPAAEVEAAIERVHSEHDVAFVLEDLGPLFDGCGEGVQRTLAIVKDLRTFSRLDSGRPSRVDLVEAIESTVTLLADRLRDVEVVRAYEPLPLVECLEGQVNQVFMNLLANAIDAGSGRGRVTIRTRNLACGRVAIEVEDEGCGIAAEHLDCIFEPFFTTKEVGSGTGLGLAISYGVVARHAGSLTVLSEPGAGSCFRLELPVEFANPPAG